MPYQVKLHREVAKTLSGMSPQLRCRIVEKLHLLEENPYEPRPGVDIARLKGTRGRADLFRMRVGDHRVIYAVDGEVVYVTDLFHRGKGYIQPP